MNLRFRPGTIKTGNEILEDLNASICVATNLSLLLRYTEIGDDACGNTKKL